MKPWEVDHSSVSVSGSGKPWEQATTSAAPELDPSKKGGTFKAKHLQPEEVEAIAARNNVDPKWLRDVTEFYTGRFVEEPTSATEAAGEIGMALVGKAGSMVGLRIPQWLYKKTKSPAERAALDELQELAYHKQSSALALLEGAAGPSAAMKLGKSLGLTTKGQAALAGIEGAILGTAYSKEGEEASSAGMGAVLGPLMVGGLAGGAKLVEKGNQLAKWGASKISKFEDISDEIFEAAQKIGQELAGEDRLLANQLLKFDIAKESAAPGLSARRKELAGLLSDKRIKTNKQAESVIRNAVAEQGQDFVNKLNNQVATRNHLFTAAQEAGVTRAPSKWNPVKRVGEAFMDARQVFKGIESRNQGAVKLLDTMDELASVKRNKYIADAQEFFDSYQDLSKATDKLKPAEIRKIYDELRSSKTPTSELGKQWRETFERMKNMANEKGLPITQLKSKSGEEMPYVPNRMMSMMDASLTLTKEAKKLGLRPDGRINSEVFDTLPESFVDAVSFLGGKTILNKNDFARAWKKAHDMSPSRYNKMISQATASKQRTGEIPEMLLEKDLNNLASSWVNNTLRHIHYREPLAEIKAQIPVLKKLGDNNGAEYLERWLRSINGELTGLAGAQRYASQAWERSFRELAEGESAPVAAGLELVGKTPALGNKLMGFLYGNALGLNVRSMARNLTQPFVMTGTEIGGAYGQKLALEAIPRAVKSGTSELKKYDLLPNAVINEARDSLHDSLISNKITKAGAMADRVTDLMMTFYQKSDIINRSVTIEMAKSLASDVANQSPKALEYVRRLAPSYRRAIQAAGNNEEELTKILAKELLAETQFNYNKFGMSEFGKVAGPFFAMFTKWPTSIVGDIAVKTQRGQAGRAAMKYLGPYVAFMAVDAMTAPGTLTPWGEDPSKFDRFAKKHSFSDVSNSERYKKVIGSSGLKGWSPFSSVTALTEENRGLANPPMVQLIEEVLKEDPNWEKLAKTYVPGAGFSKLLLEDIPTVVTNKKPDGRFIGRKTGLDFYTPGE